MMDETASILPREGIAINTLKSQGLCLPRRRLPPELNAVILLLLGVPDILNCRRVRIVITCLLIVLNVLSGIANLP